MGPCHTDWSRLHWTRYHVPSNIKDFILDYYNNFRITAGSSTSDWHRLEKGIITGCTISVTLFFLAMNMVVKSAEVECRGPLTKSGARQPPIRAFMDDLTITVTTVPGTRWIPQGLENLISWAKMNFNPSKSGSNCSCLTAWSYLGWGGTYQLYSDSLVKSFIICPYWH